MRIKPMNHKKIIPIMILALSIVLVSSTTSYSQTNTTPTYDTLGAKYCGSVEKMYGIIGTTSNTTYDRVISGKYYYIEITGIIDTSTEEYVKYAIQIAEENNAALIILLNTPGGYLDPATNIVTIIDDAKIPVIGYVVDKWAESAGTLILMSTHIAAMQPGTIIGSMQPIAYDPQTGSYQPINDSKIINPLIKLLCEHAATKGRNSTALARFVLYNDNYGAYEALDKGVIEIVASDTTDLISKLNNLVVALPSGYTYAFINGDGAITVEEIPPPPRVIVIHALSDPILSGILLSLGMLILLFSIISGHLAYATIGALFLILGMAGTGYNINMVTILLLALGALLVVIEMHTPGFGVLGGVGIVMLVLGIALLPAGAGFAVPQGYANTLLASLYITGAIMGVFTVYVVYKVLEVRKRQPIVWSITGKIGETVDDLEPGKPGFIIVEGEYWKAISNEFVPRGSKVKVLRKEGPVLYVEKIEE